MPYNPETGEWVDEDASVEKRVTGLMSKRSPLMQQAEAQGLKLGNRRGLLNSSVSVGAAQAAAYNVALPIASQEASQSHALNVQGRDIASRERMQGRQFEHESGLQERQFGHERGMQETDISARERMQGRQFEHETGLQGRDIASRERMLGSELASRERMAQFEADVRERIAGLDREAQERIASMNVASSERAAAASMAANFEAAYAQMFSNIMNNPEIPANVRDRYIRHASAVRDSNLRLVEQLYSIDLQWSTPGTTGSGDTVVPTGGLFPSGFNLNIPLA